MIHPDVIGCDISKAHLDLFDSGLSRHHRIDNTPAAMTAWLETLDGRAVHVVLEATGRYDRRLCAALEAAGRPYSRLNPARARNFARAAGVLAKTDAIDARLLARMGQSLSPAPQAPRDPVRQALSRLHTRRDQLVAMRQQGVSKRERACTKPTSRSSVKAWRA